MAISYNIIMYYPYGIKLYYNNFIQYNHVLSISCIGIKRDMYSPYDRKKSETSWDLNPAGLGFFLDLYLSLLFQYISTLLFNIKLHSYNDVTT